MMTILIIATAILWPLSLYLVAKYSTRKMHNTIEWLYKERAKQIALLRRLRKQGNE